MPGIDAGIGRVAHLAEHINAAKPIRLAKPFKGGDKPHRASGREAINKYRFHWYVLRDFCRSRCAA
jgi:hypothetical protein